MPHGKCYSLVLLLAAATIVVVSPPLEEKNTDPFRRYRLLYAGRRRELSHAASSLVIFGFGKFISVAKVFGHAMHIAVV
jgi:hypothetical protein